ncbi:anhydro-N-acetylmuramic acid kinase [Roseibium litorale]|uniref:Anhydro-N-acetylmuramic acid kinase n=1 Tax=Roseibium litorale TaxID=2803841 RepID=A0ABR9CN19_9HYPH|nr:anhydro-N-acetylmuramic acid kinase [Roseibium litorale]MBD8892266.1 anhydro-N-acetylmuramic acid kinase [Roseibium litorale]
MWSVVGTISGTSADGIDLAEILTDGISVERFGPGTTAPYRAETRKAVLSAIAKGPKDRSAWPALARAVTDDHAAALEAYLAEHGLLPDAVVFHGQTVWHDPSVGETVQLGEPQALADRLGLPVIGDVRLADMAEGGQGAPLVPVYHQALARELDQPLCFLNIGGVSNLTYLNGDDILAFDIGPGNALLDDWIRKHGAGEFDENGAVSAKGTVHQDRIATALEHPFFTAPGPKSLDRNAFSMTVAEGLSLQDGAATMVALTAGTIGLSEKLLPKVPALWIVCGGGRLNPTLMAALRSVLQGDVRSSEEFGIDGNALEAQAMAFLGARFQAGLPTSFPSTTGASRPVCGGKLYLPQAQRRIA